MKKVLSSKGRKTLTSIQELRKEFGLKEINWTTKDPKKLQSQQERFLSNHVCPICKAPMDYIEGTNVMICKNSSCKGIEKKAFDDETEEEYSTFEVSFNQLDERGAKIASNIFKK